MKLAALGRYEGAITILLLLLLTDDSLHTMVFLVMEPWRQRVEDVHQRFGEAHYLHFQCEEWASLKY
jgi:hypothetical protein